jgi:3-hydroxybutyryl-CoA dehydrogenase
MKINSICAVGGGLMGRQIALNAAMSGFNAVVYDLKPEVCDAVVKWADDYLKERVEKGKLKADVAEQVRKRFSVKKNLKEAVAGVDCVVECIVEVLDIKKAFFKELCEVVGENVIIATNSSYMVSSLFVDSVKNPSRLCNMHYYNPALVMKFVEVVQGPHTNPDVCAACMEFCKTCGKTPIWMKKEIDGFAGNYLIVGLHQRARKLVQDGYCTFQDVDIAMEQGFNHPMGPFRLCDLTGVDLAWDIMKARYDKTGVKEDMHDVFEQMIKEGRKGRKVGKGFYDYTK